MTTPKLVSGAQKLLEPFGEAKVLQISGTCAATLTAQTTLSTAAASKIDSVCGPPKTIISVQSLHSSPSALPVAGPLPQMSTSASPSSIMVVAKMAAAAGGVSANGQLQVTKPPMGQVTSMNQAPTPGRTVVIAVPRTANPQPVTVAPRLPQSSSSHLPANIQIPAGMMLIRSDTGQLMLVSQQALAQAQQGTRVTSGQAPRIVSHQVSAANGSKGNEKVTVIRMAAPPSFLPPPAIQKTALVKVVSVAPKAAVTQNAASAHESQPRIQAPVTETRKETPATFTQETLESVKKCKNFLVTLIKLASSDSRSANMANNVRGLVRNLLEGKLEAEEFTEQLYQELKSTPQPCLVPFLKKSLPAVRRLTADPQLFIQQASTSACNSSAPMPATDTGANLHNSKQVIQPARKVIMRPAVTSLTLPRNYISKSNSSISSCISSRPNMKQTLLQPGKPLPGTFSLSKQPFTQDPSGFKTSSGSYREDDDINDVAFMAGVNLREENAKFLTTTVGSVVQSCHDQPFLSPNKVLSRILRAGQPLGVTDVGPEVLALVSHATQECLRGLLEKLTLTAEHRKAALKEDAWHAKVSDIRAQLRYLEEVETLNKKRKDEAEREKLMRLARSRSHPEDPQFQLLKQKAKELQQMEEAQLQQREANMTALAAIGPRRKRPLELTETQVSLLPRLDVPRVTRVILRDLLVCMEQDHFLRHSLTLYKAML